MSDILNKVEQIARMANIRGERNGDLLLFSFDMGHGRDQLVAVAHFGETKDGLNIITFFSPCQRISSGVLGGLAKSRAVNLLRHNSQLPFGHFCIMPINDEETVCVRSTQILETMEVQEFEANCVSIAQIADKWEEKLGRDEF